MRIAVSYKDGEVFQHFGHSTEFKIYETDHNEIILRREASKNDSGTEAGSDLGKKIFF